MEELPLISYCLKNYNQERYIRSTLKCALDQTYRPLEIVISDDCSTDRSWEIIQEVVADYKAKGGDLPIILNRNEENLGNIGNWVKLMQLSHGELCVKADGDDISYPERTATVVKAWLAGGKKAAAISHAAYYIDGKGHRFGVFRSSSVRSPLGAVMTFLRDCLTAFENNFSRNEPFYDDNIFAPRALMIGDEICMPDILGEYRLGSGATSSLYDLRRQLANYRAVASGILVALTELEGRRSYISSSRYEELRRYFICEKEEYGLMVALISSTSYNERLTAFRSLPKIPWFLPLNYQRMAYLIGGRLGAAMNAMYMITRYWIKRISFCAYVGLAPWGKH